MTDDKAAQLMDEAAGKLRDALHASYGRPAYPSVLYGRAGAIVDILSRVQQAARMLSETTMAAPWMFALGSCRRRDRRRRACRHRELSPRQRPRPRLPGPPPRQPGFSALSHLKLESWPYPSRLGSNMRSVLPLKNQEQARGVRVDLTAVFGPPRSSGGPPEGLVLEVVPGGLQRWVKSTGGWIGVVTWVGRTTAGESVKAADQWITAAALQPRP